MILPEEGLSLDGLERGVILAALQKFRGNQSKAARYLSVTRKVLLNRITKHGIKKAEVHGPDQGSESEASTVAEAPGLAKPPSAVRRAFKQAS